MMKKLINILYLLMPYSWFIFVLVILVWLDVDWRLHFRQFSYWTVFVVLLICGMGYTTIDTFFYNYAVRLKKWLAMASLVIIAMTFSIYYLWLTDYQIVISIGIFLASLPLGGIIWIEKNNGKQSFLYKKEDYDRLSTFINSKQILVPDFKGVLLERSATEHLSFKIDMNETIYKECSRELLQYVVGEIKFPGAYLFLTYDDETKASLIMKTQKGEPHLPHIFCDGSDNAILVYNDTTTIALCHILDDFAALIGGFERLYVTEVDLESKPVEHSCSYFVPITKIEILKEENTVEKLEELEELEELNKDISEMPLPAQVDNKDQLPNNIFEDNGNKEIIYYKNMLIEALRECDVSIERIRATIARIWITYDFSLNSAVTSKKTDLFRSRINLYFRLVQKDDKTISVEIPYKNGEPLKLDNFLKFKSYVTSNAMLKVALGVNGGNEAEIYDLTDLCHILIAGGDAKSRTNFLHITAKLLIQGTQQGVIQLMLIGLNETAKDIEPNNLCKFENLAEVISEMDSRNQRLTDTKCHSVTEYNTKHKDSQMPYLVLIANLQSSNMDTFAKLEQLALLSHQVGIHTIVSVADILPSVLNKKFTENYPTRIAFRTETAEESKLILEEFGAEILYNEDEILYKDKNNFHRIQTIRK